MSPASRMIAVDVCRERGPRSSMPQFCVGSGRAHEGLLAEHQRHLESVLRGCGFRYLRFHGLLHDDMGVYTEDPQGRPVHNWQYIDLLFDALLDLGIRPFVELGFMPPPLASGSETVFWWRGNVTLPKDQGRWNDLIGALAQHWISRYGIDEVRSWYFEVWNEPNLRGFFAGDQEDYFQLYAETARTLKAADPGLRVGGPATAGCEWVPEFLDFCHRGRVPVDFVSTHFYGVDGSFDEYGVQQTFLKPDALAIVAEVQEVRRQIEASPYPGLELHFTEWSTSYSPADPVHDSYISAAYILSRLKRCEGLVQSMSYWTFTDLFEEPGPPRRPFHGGFGLVNLQGLPKPSFFAYRYLALLGPLELVQDDPDAWVCRSDTGVQALFWNRTPVGEGQSNQKFYVQDWPAVPIGTVALSLRSLTPGEYKVGIRRTGYRKNDVFTASLALDIQGSLSRSQEAELRNAVLDEPVYQFMVVGGDGELRMDLPLEENEVVFCSLELHRPVGTINGGKHV